jgi:four helix bundle protein
MIIFEKITAYKLSSDLSDNIWKIVRGWSVLAQKTLGEQLIRSIDSVAANIIEGEGRYFKKDKVKFFYQARGSALETIHWIEKAYKRNLIDENSYKSIVKTLNELPKEINYLISNTMRNLKK